VAFISPLICLQLLCLRYRFLVFKQRKVDVNLYLLLHFSSRVHIRLFENICFLLGSAYFVAGSYGGGADGEEEMESESIHMVNPSFSSSPKGPKVLGGEAHL
jgi:hypothetical protein